MSEHHDVLIVGAGLSGIGAAVHLQRHLPQKSYAILEARQAIGGTWDLFRYPGIRSDSDMFTLGYSFRPWTDAKSIADGETIRRYVKETAREYGVEPHIRFGHRVVAAHWDSETARWTVEAERLETGERLSMTCSFIHCCTGYYRYDQGFTPNWEGVERFRGQIVHPQHWPEDLDYAGKRVVVIGSGATAVTLVPAMAQDAAHVTMLQRSPTYIISLPEEDALANALRRLLPAKLAYQLARLEHVALTALSFQLSRRRPELMKRILRRGLESQLPEGYDIDRHFSPRYDPWDQRLCVVPNGDLFRAIRHGSASVVTDRIETFTEEGIRLVSGQELPADIIVTATGLNLQMLGGARVFVDGAEVDPGSTVAYKGMMFSGIPNAALSVGYTNASWTLKCDLICEYVCRLIAYMDEHGHDWCVPVEPPLEQQRRPLLDLSSGYILRSIDKLPKQGERTPWRVNQNWFLDIGLFRRSPIDDEGMRFGSAGEPVRDREPLRPLASAA
jgi:monooxygenase